MAQDDDDDGPPGESKDTAKAAGAIQIAFDELKNGDLAGPGAEKAPAGVLLADTDDGEPDDGELMTDDEIEALPLFEP
jgi:hypothetical protein